jgi:CHAT domain-containing protein
MRRTLALTITVVILSWAGFVTRAERQAPRGLIVESIHQASATIKAGLQVGDELISWTRSVPSSTAGVARGDFRTPFDAREFEIEQLPRGGTSVTFVRDGKRIEASLIPGFWGVAARPAFSVADLAAYDAGRALQKDKPDEALAAWQSISDRATQDGDVATAGWLLTGAASALISARRIDRGDEIFDRAASLFRQLPNPAFEAMVWEAKGEAYFSEINPGWLGKPNRTVDRRDSQVALDSHQRARELRAQVGARTLAEAESQIRASQVRVGGLQKQDENKVSTLPATSDDERQKWLEVGAQAETALALIADQAPRSFLHARAVVGRGSFVRWNNSDRVPGAVPVAQASAAADLLWRQAWPIFDAVAPQHPLLYFTLTSIRGLPADAQEKETFVRRRREVAAAFGDYSYLDSGARQRARELGERGAYEEAIGILEGLLASGRASGGDMNQLARFHRDRGDFAAAEQIVITRLDQAQLTLGARAGLTNDLGAYASDRGDWSSAEVLFRRALDFSEQDARDRFEARQKYWAAQSGPLTADQTDQQTREANLDFFRQRSYYWNLSVAAERRGDVEQTQKLVQRVLEMSGLRKPLAPEYKEKNPSGWRNEMVEQGNLIFFKMKLAELRGDSAAADELAMQRLTLSRRELPGTVTEALALEDAGHRQWMRKELDKAAVSLNEALMIRQRLQPGRAQLAHAHHMLGRLMLDRGDRKAAITHFEAALEVLDNRRTRRSVGDGSLSMLSTAGEGSATGVAADLVELLASDGQFERAFNLLEQSRSRGLFDMLSARELRETSSVPPALREERRRLETEYDQLQDRIETLGADQAGKAIDADLARLHELAVRLSDLDRRVAQLDPRSANLKRPVPLTLAEARGTLDAGTALLSYLVGAERTHLFVVTPVADAPHNSGLSVYTIETTSADLRKSVDAFRTLIDWDTTVVADRAAVQKRAGALYDLLIRPAESRIAGARRLLFSLDGPLHKLPLAALVRQEAGRPQYLVEWKALHTTPSMSVYAETRAARRTTAAAGSIVAFGDPRYPQTQPTSGDADVEFMTRRGLTLTPLPGTRREVEAIQQQFGSRVTTYLGDAATEGRARSIGTSARYIHFAVHGVFNDQLPLNSALAFTMPGTVGPGEDNGLLQAWEIIEKMRIDADLVTLSACESGLGKEIAGEGLIGLTRAFLYAGAHTVAASLWKVADGPTAQLMKNFYANLRSGQTKDEALRNAQISLIRIGKRSGIDFGSPAHWAAFTLTGDWK